MIKIILFTFQVIPAFFFIKRLSDVWSVNLIIIYTIFYMGNIAISSCFFRNKKNHVHKLLYYCLMWYFALFLAILSNWIWILYAVAAEVIIKALIKRSARKKLSRTKKKMR